MSLWKKLKASLESRKAATIKEETKLQEDCINKAKEAKRKARIARGKEVFQQKQRENPFLQSKPISKIQYHEYFTSGHNDSAISISLIDVDGNTLWKTHISDSYEEDACALKAYLADHFHCPVEVIEL